MKYRAKPMIIDAFRYGHDQWPHWFAHALETDVVSIYENDDPFEIPGVFIKRPHVIFCPHGSYLLLDMDGTIRYESEEVFQMKYEALSTEDESSLRVNNVVTIDVPSLLRMMYGDKIIIEVHEYEGSFLFSFASSNALVSAWYDSIAYAIGYSRTMKEAVSTIKEEIRRRFDEASRVDL